MENVTPQLPHVERYVMRLFMEQRSNELQAQFIFDEGVKHNFSRAIISSAAISLFNQNRVTTRGTTLVAVCDDNFVNSTTISSAFTPITSATMTVAGPELAENHNTPELIASSQNLPSREDLQTMFRTFFPCTEADIRKFATKTFLFSVGIDKHIQKEARKLGVSTPFWLFVSPPFVSPIDCHWFPRLVVMAQ